VTLSLAPGVAAPPATVLELARIEVRPGMEREFEIGVGKALPIFQAVPGWRGMELRRSTEYPNRFHLLARWDSVEAHAVEFRQSAAFVQWRALVEHCFAGPPEVEHTTLSLMGR
jgi:heme-degrading monooxygenase HmoA